MLFFKRKSKDPVTIVIPAESRIEIELHKSATVEAAAVALKAANHLTDLAHNNGFTMRLFKSAHPDEKKEV